MATFFFSSSFFLETKIGHEWVRKTEASKFNCFQQFCIARLLSFFLPIFLIFCITKERLNKKSCVVKVNIKKVKSPWLGSIPYEHIYTKCWLCAIFYSTKTKRFISHISSLLNSNLTIYFDKKPSSTQHNVHMHLRRVKTVKSVLIQVVFTH